MGNDIIEAALLDDEATVNKSTCSAAAKTVAAVGLAGNKRGVCLTLPILTQCLLCCSNCCSAAAKTVAAAGLTGSKRGVLCVSLCIA